MSEYENQFIHLFGEGKFEEMLHAHSMVQLYWLVLVSWIADHPENYNFYSNKINICPTYTVNRHNLVGCSPEALL
jgi:hypothetical protein